MIEAVAVVTVLVLSLAGALFLHRQYAGKIRANREARAAAWSRALDGCRGNNGIDELWARRDAGIDAAEVSRPGILRIAHVGASSSVAAPRVPSPLGNLPSRTLSASHEVACNDELSDEVHDAIMGPINKVKEQFVKYFPYAFP